MLGINLQSSVYSRFGVKLNSLPQKGSITSKPCFQKNRWPFIQLLTDGCIAHTRTCTESVLDSTPVLLNFFLGGCVGQLVGLSVSLSTVSCFMTVTHTVVQAGLGLPIEPNLP